MTYSIILGTLMFSLLPFSSQGQAMFETCDIGAFVNETDPKGLNIRAEPNAKSAVVGILPAVSQRVPVRIEVEISKTQGGWMHIRNAQDNSSLMEMNELPLRKVPSVAGWVSGKLLTVKSQSQFGYAKPSEVSAQLYSVKENEAAFDTEEKMKAVKLLDCRGKWAYVEFNKKKFWLNKICAIQETSCSGF